MNNVEKIKILKQLDNCIKDFGDEEAWLEWITIGVPDEATEEQLKEIVEDEEAYEEILNAFIKIKKTYEIE